MVGRHIHRPAVRVPGAEVRRPERRRDVLARQHDDPGRGGEPLGRAHLHELRLRPAGRRADGQLHLVHHAGSRGEADRRGTPRWEGRRLEPARVPGSDYVGQDAPVLRLQGHQRPRPVEQHLRSNHHGLKQKKARGRKRLAPYGLTSPGVLWLAIFFLIPMGAMLVLSLETRTPTPGFKNSGYQFTWHIGEYSTPWAQAHVQLLRSPWDRAILTIVTPVPRYPAA